MRECHLYSMNFGTIMSMPLILKLLFYVGKVLKFVEQDKWVAKMKVV